LFVTLSHRVFPVVGETRRFTTAVLNSFVQARAATYLDSLNTTLREAGLTGGLAFFQGLGGGIGHERAKEFPLSLLGSGPAAGARGAADLTKRTGHSKVLLGDMGGTSFDTGMIVDHEVRITKSLQLGPFRTGVNVMDLVSVGAGGGSVVWVSERGVPQVGPQSAGSTPGPVALDRGGTEPTVTDALITLGFIDPARYLDGRVKVDPSLARTALERTLGQRFGWSAEEAASAVHDLVVVNMANAVREVSIGKGYDPREFVFLAYGGTLPLFASQIAERLGITTIIVPRDSSVFCARGLLASDFVLRLDQAVGWDLSRPERFDRANAVADSLTAAATAAIQKDGFHEDDCTVLATADFRFQSQEYELTMAMPQRELREEDAAGLHAQFVELYEKTYGQGTAWEGVPSTMVNYSVTVTGHRPHPPAVYADGDSGAGGSRVPPVREYREVYLPTARARETVPIVDDAALTAGMTIRGPAMVDGGDTTVYVPSGTSAARDSYGNLVLTRGGSPNAGS
jgi:N-methylhydantoinase A